jgi:hypothetical protein
MQKQRLTHLILAALVSTPALADSEMDQLRQQVESLQAQLNQTASAVEGIMQQDSGTNATSVGGYGEMHYNNIETKTNGVVTGTNREIDFHRFVLFFNHDFSQRVRLHSELELEHSIAGESQPGEIELEQAYVEFDLNDNQSVKGGLFLVPVGILNETHEPTTFYGVERNPVESKIIPVTWWEGGAGLSGELAPGWGYDLALHSGLNTTTGDIRSGRQKVAGANANDWAMTGRIKYTGIPGTELALTAQSQSDIAQSANADANSATLLETHVIWNNGPFGARALYAKWDIDGTAPKAAGKDKQDGYYVEGSYKVLPQLGIFARYNAWDNSAGDNVDSKEDQTNVGLNWWPHEDVVVKFDIQSYEMGNTKKSGYNAGLGYQF